MSRNHFTEAELTTQDVLELAKGVDGPDSWEADDPDLGELTLIDDSLWGTAIDQLFEGLGVAL